MFLFADQVMLYFLHTLDPIVERPFVVVYLHTLTTGDNMPYSQFLKDMYGLLDKRYVRVKHVSMCFL